MVAVDAMVRMVAYGLFALGGRDDRLWVFLSDLRMLFMVSLLEFFLNWWLVLFDLWRWFNFGLWYFFLLFLLHEMKCLYFWRLLKPIRLCRILYILTLQPQLFANGPRKSYQLIEVYASFQGWIFLVHLQNLPCSLFSKYDASHVHEHCQTHCIYELKLFIFTRVLRFQKFQEYRVPNDKWII